jgi:metal-responsive CopG/Arc/MetJ family transcriptional regulator
MPTRKPRIMLTLDEETFSTVAELAEITKQSRSGLIADILKTFVPSMMIVLKLEKAAGEAKEGLLSGIGGHAERAEAMELEMRQMLNELSKVADGGGATAPTPASTPVPVTRGSKKSGRSKQA